MPRRAAILTLVLLAAPARLPQAPAPAEPSAPVEATSLLGTPLRRPPVPPDSRERLESQLEEARAAWEASPRSEEAIIWYGRRLAYLGRFREAIEVFGRGLEIHPDSPGLLRHRGHRLITVRRLDDAIADLARASDLAAGAPDEVEPDGAPNAANIPRGTLRTNIFYHLGLACYLEGQWRRSRFAYRRCLQIAANDDMKVAASYWIYLTLRRESAEAGHVAAILDPITPDMEILENGGYHALLMMFKGARTPEQVMEGIEPGSVEYATRSYGIGAWHLLEGRREQAEAIFRRVADGPQWAAFGSIAAEAELARRPGQAPLIDEARLIDLTHPFNADSIYWPTARKFDLTQAAHGRGADGRWYASNDFCASEHGGTHIDAPIHFAEGRTDTAGIPIGRLTGPARVIDIMEQCSADRDYLLAPADILAHEERHGPIGPGSVVLVRTGFGRFYPDAKKYLGSDVRGEASNLHFPGIGEAAARLLAERRVDLVGLDTASLDHGPSTDFIAHRVLNGADIPGLENLANLERLPPAGAWVIALPMKIEGGTGGPCRIIAVLP